MSRSTRQSIQADFVHLGDRTSARPVRPPSNRVARREVRRATARWRSSAVGAPTFEERSGVLLSIDARAALRVRVKAVR